MGDVGPNETKYAGVSNERPGSQFWQLFIKSFRQIRACLPDVLFNEMIVVDQPFGSRGYGFSVSHRSTNCPLGREKSLRIVTQTFKDRICFLLCVGNQLAFGKAPRMLLGSFNTEYFSSYGLVIMPWRYGKLRRTAKQAGHDLQFSNSTQTC